MTSLQISRVLAAPPERVWAAATELSLTLDAAAAKPLHHLEFADVGLRLCRTARRPQADPLVELAHLPRHGRFRQHHHDTDPPTVRLSRSRRR